MIGEMQSGASLNIFMTYSYKKYLSRAHDVPTMGYIIGQAPEIMVNKT